MDKLINVSSQVKDALKKSFDKKYVPILVNKLENTEFPLISNHTERVHLSIIIASQGDVEKFHQYLKLSTIDWRDTLVSAGLADENWRDVLEDKGFSVL